VTGGLGFAVLTHMDRRRHLLDVMSKNCRLPSRPVRFRKSFGAGRHPGNVSAAGDGCKWGCIIGNMSTALSDCHDGFANVWPNVRTEMAQEFLPTWRRRLGTGT